MNSSAHAVAMDASLLTIEAFLMFAVLMLVCFQLFVTFEIRAAKVSFRSAVAEFGELLKDE
jgi:hypothetical protein